MRHRSLAILTAGHMFADMNQGLLPALLPFLIIKHHLSFEAAAGLVFAANIMSSVVQPLFGHFADRVPTFYIMPLGVLLAGFGMAVAGIVSDYWIMFLAVAVSGIGIAAFHPEAARLTNYVSGGKKGTGVSTFTAGGNIGIALGPVIAICIANIWGLEGTLLLTVPTIAIAALFVLQRAQLVCPKSSSRFQNSQGHSDEWGAFLRLTVAITFRSIIIFGINTFLPLYWIHVLHQPVAVGSSILTIIFVIGAIASLVAGRLADRFGTRLIVRAGFTVLVPALLVFVQVRDVFFATVMLIPIAIALFASFSPMVVLGQRYLPNHVGLASGITLGLAVSIGGTFAPVFGRIADNYGVQATLMVISFLPILAIIAAFALPVPRIDQTKESGVALPGEATSVAR